MSGKITHVYFVYSSPQAHSDSELKVLVVQALNQARPNWQSDLDPAGQTATTWITDPIGTIDLLSSADQAFGGGMNLGARNTDVVKFQTEDGSGAILLVR